MKTKSTITRYFLLFALLAAAIGSLAFAPLPPTLAEAPTPQPKLPKWSEIRGETLELMFKRETAWLEQQVQHLKKMDEIAARAQTLITQAAAEGKDVAGLQTALDAFKGQQTAGLASHQKAAEILKTRSGFDAAGKVTDRTAARETVNSARKALRECHLTVQAAMRKLNLAVREWRQAHRPTAGPATTSGGE